MNSLLFNFLILAYLTLNVSATVSLHPIVLISDSVEVRMPWVVSFVAESIPSWITVRKTEKTWTFTSAERNIKGCYNLQYLATDNSSENLRVCLDRSHKLLKRDGVLEAIPFEAESRLVFKPAYAELYVDREEYSYKEILEYPVDDFLIVDKYYDGEALHLIIESPAKQPTCILKNDMSFTARAKISQLSDKIWAHTFVNATSNYVIECDSEPVTVDESKYQDYVKLSSEDQIAIIVDASAPITNVFNANFDFSDCIGKTECVGNPMVSYGRDFTTASTFVVEGKTISRAIHLSPKNEVRTTLPRTLHLNEDFDGYFTVPIVADIPFDHDVEVTLEYRYNDPVNEIGTILETIVFPRGQMNHDHNIQAYGGGYLKVTSKSFSSSHRITNKIITRPISNKKDIIFFSVFIILTTIIVGGGIIWGVYAIKKKR